MRAKKVLCVLLTFCLFLTTGCWDQKVLQDMFYVVALGSDYKNNQYITYAQFMDFSQVAKTEQGKASQKVPLWLAKGTGVTFTDALRDVVSKSPQPLVLSHVSAFVLTESAMKHGLTDFLAYIRRFPDLRLTGWMFGAKGDLQEILSASPLFNLAPLTMIEHTPESITKEHTFIPPLQARDFIMRYQDTGSTVLLPSLSITDAWYEGTKPHPQPYIDGAYLFQKEKYRTWMSVHELLGARWCTKVRRTLLSIPSSSGKAAKEIAVLNVSPSIKVRMKNGTPIFDLRVKGSATVISQVGRDHIDQMVNREIEKEITSTFKNGLKERVDVLNLENTLYRRHNQIWKQAFQKNHLSIQKDMLGSVNAEIKVVHAGRLRLDS